MNTVETTLDEPSLSNLVGLYHFTQSTIPATIQSIFPGLCVALINMTALQLRI